jgi:hypothetical protein
LCERGSGAGLIAAWQKSGVLTYELAYFDEETKTLPTFSVVELSLIHE